MTRDAEQLAEAIEQGTPPGSVADPGLARDLRIVAMLRARGAAFDPTPDARARARARLVAAMAESAPAAGQAPPPAAAETTAPIAPVREPAVLTTAEIAPVVDDAPAGGAREHGDEPVDQDVPVHAPDVGGARPRRSRHGLASRPAGRDGGPRRPAARSGRRRIAAVVAASLVALVGIAVGGDLASRSALPGDPLYAIKRASENVGLALTFDEQARAQRHLELATTRIDEVERLVARDATGGVDPALVEGVIAEFDSATGEGSRALLAAQDASGPAVLGDLQAWAAEQAARLSVLRSALPEPAVGEVDSSIALLDRLLGRTEALEARSSCTEVTSSVVDDLGPLAAEGSCTPRPAGSAGDTATDPTGGTSAPGTTTSGGAGAPAGSGAPGSTEAPGPLPGSGSDGLPLPDGDAPVSSSTAPDDGDVSVPLPLVPPIQLPPLLPGLPGVSIG